MCARGFLLDCTGLGDVPSSSEQHFRVECSRPQFIDGETEAQTGEATSRGLAAHKRQSRYLNLDHAFRPGPLTDQRAINGAAGSSFLGVCACSRGHKECALLGHVCAAVASVDTCEHVSTRMPRCAVDVWGWEATPRRTPMRAVGVMSKAEPGRRSDLDSTPGADT